MEKFDKAIRIFTDHHGLMRSGQAIEAGIAPKTLYAMRDQGIIVRISRGLYHLADLPLPGNIDLITVALKVPNAIFCLISALDFYNLTEQVPHFIYFSLPQGARRPEIDYPPVKIFWPSKKVYSAGINEVFVEGKPIRIYTPEKTIPDCFKFRNKIGIEVAIDALRRYFNQPTKAQDLNALINFARLNRVEKIITPYIESLI